MGGKTIDQRIAVTALAFGVLLAALTWRCYDLQIIQHERLTRLAVRQQERTLDVQPPRGRIFDRQGRPLALNRESASFFAVPAEVRDPERTAQRLAPLLGLPASQLAAHLRASTSFVWLKRKVADPAAQAITALRCPGVHRMTETQRYYPEGRLACHVLGFVGVDNQGLDGVELQFDRALRGSAGWMRVARDARGEIVESATRWTKPAEAGADVTLTLDNVVQHTAERELARAVEQYHARAGSLVVLDPASGEVLALANAPDFDPNAPLRFTAEARRDRAVRDVYEPGSTFKLVTAAAALSEGVCTEDTPVDCAMGNARLGGRVVRDHLPHGRIPFHEVFSYSSNIGTVKIGQRVGAERLVRYAHAFGFGRLTGVELPGEAAGLLKPSARWNPATLASVPYGQEVAVTTLQSTLAYAAVANGGWLPRPTLVKSVQAPDGAAQPADRSEVRQQVLTAQVAERLRNLLIEVVAKGTGTEAQVPNYATAGKTGTAQKSLSGGRGYDPYRCVASFIGFLPAEHPRLLIAVVIDAPQGVEWGGVVAGPVFKAVSQDLVAYLGIPPETAVARAPEAGTPAAAPVACVPRTDRSVLVRVPDLSGLNTGACQTALSGVKLRLVSRGRGPCALAQQPAANTELPAGLPVTVTFGESGRVGVIDQVPVPNLAGQTLRNALQVLAAYGFTARISGSGVVCTQSPRPDSFARLGSVCALECHDPEALP